MDVKYNITINILFSSILRTSNEGMEVTNMIHPIFKKIEIITECNYFKQIFQGASDLVLDSCKVIEIEKDTRFVTAKDPMNQINILLSGSVKAIEEYISGDVYIFKEFTKPYIFGEMEAMAGMRFYRASLVADTNCIIVTIPTSIFINYLKSNTDILFRRSQLVINQLIEDEKDNRTYLMLDATNRIKVYFLNQYEYNPRNEACLIRKTRQEIADATGYSVKTVNRVMKRLQEEGYLKVAGQKILITKDQYNKIKACIDEIIELE